MKKNKYYFPFVLQKIGYLIFFTLYKIFVRLEIKGRENLLGLSGAVILAANHTSELDATALPLVLPFFSKLFPVYFVANPIEKFKTFGWRGFFYGGVFFSMLGAYPIFSGNKSYALSLEKHIELLHKDRTVCIFPEGRRTKNGRLNPAHGGLAYLTHTTGATVVPIAVNTFFGLSAADFFLRRHKVILTVCKPMLPTEIISPEIKNPTADDFQAGSQKVLEKIGEVMQ